MKGIKRHLWVDLPGFPLHPVVHDAGIQDRGPHSLERYKEKAQKAEIVPGRLSRMDALANQEKLKIGIVKRGEEKAFRVLPKCWIVERSFAWLEPARRLAKHDEKSRQNAGSHDPATLHTNRNQQNYKTYLLDRF